MTQYEIFHDVLGQALLEWQQRYQTTQAAAERLAAERAAHAEAERRAYEIQLSVLNETLEQRVAERTADLKRSNQELDQFAYIAAHDLKAPLRAIDHLARWIMDDAYDVLPEPSKVNLAKLRERIKRMEKLTDDLLAYSRAGRTVYTPEVVETAALVKEIAKGLAIPPSFTIRVEEPMPVVYTVREPLSVVLRNLIGNAIKHHNNQADGLVQITAQDQGDQIEFSVVDNGPGIASEFHRRIFQMFQTVRPRDQVEGSGTGLAIAKKIVESYGGSIQIESTEGQGATFHFTWRKTH